MGRIETLGDAGRRLDWVVGLATSFWESASSNSLHLEQEERAWLRPRIAVAAGDDPIFERLKEMIGPFYWTPMDAYKLAFPDSRVDPGQLRVISYVLPQTEKTRQDQRREHDMPSERWARSRFYGEMFNRELRSQLAASLTDAGYPAVAPERLPGFAYRESVTFGIASNWSERHAAFVAGHGTFGLSDGLITPWGKAVRLGSVVARIELPVTPRPYGDDYQAWCLWYARGQCCVCAARCPAGAVTKGCGHDKQACFTYIRQVTAPYVRETYGVGDTPCGLCQVRIPCEARSPVS